MNGNGFVLHSVGPYVNNTGLGRVGLATVLGCIVYTNTGSTQFIGWSESQLGPSFSGP